MLNKIMLIGNLVADPKGPRPAGSSTVTDFRIAVSERWGSGDNQQRTLFIDVECWGKTAETAAAHLHKGRRVFVEGSLQIDEWADKDGQQRSKPKIKAVSVQFLDRATSGDDDPGDAPHDDGRGRAPGGNGGSGGKSRLPDYGLDDSIPF